MQRSLKVFHTMKFSEKWLREWVNPNIDTATLVEQLTHAGLEVDAVKPVAGDFADVLVGQVVAVEPHPNADKLRCCKVDVAGDELLSIVCGAANVRQGLKAPVAVVGSVLTGSFTIKKAKIRGVESFGMLCGASELGLVDNGNGLMELADDAPIGIDFREYIDIDDVAIDIDLTPNRSDCLGIAGIAREVGVLTGCDLTQWRQEPIIEQSTKTVEITIEETADCPRYIGRVIENANVKATTPLWMQKKLRCSGISSLGPVVDVSNYVMLELGQPMHVFDLEKLTGGITVRNAKNNETLTLLDGQEINVIENTLVIADDASVLVLAGIMGGEASSVTTDTKHLFLEAAHFSPLAIAGRARAYGLHTDSSHRFERGVDPELPRQAIERATALLLDIVGGQAAPITEQLSTSDLPETKIINLRASRIKRVLGITIAAKHIEDWLTRLGLTVEANTQGWQVTVPSFRFDLAVEVDLIEELGRLYGYDKLPETRPQGTVLTTNISEHTLATHRLQSLLVDRGYQEAITYSFGDPAIQQYFSVEGEQAIELANPISADLSIMRTSLWAGLIQALIYNLNRQHERVRLFEVGCSFSGTQDKIKQYRQIAGVVCGSRYAEQWAERQQPVDFFDIKADVETLLDLGGEGTISFIAEQHPALHPGQSARVYQGDIAIGWVGALHPRLNKPLELNTKVYVFELTLSAVLKARLPTFESLSKFPAIRRDLALLVNTEVRAGEVEHCLNSIKSDIIKSIQLFDVYNGIGVKDNKKSIAVAFQLQHLERTLTDEEVDEVIQTVTEKLQQQVGATIRA